MGPLWLSNRYMYFNLLVEFKILPCSCYTPVDFLVNSLGEFGAPCDFSCKTTQLFCLTVVFNRMSKKQSQSMTVTNQKKGFALSLANENSKLKQVNGSKRGKTRMTNSRLFLVLHLIG